MTGEIFARSQGFLNSHVVDLVEAAGAEMVVPPFQEWIYHVNKCVQLFAAAQGKTLSRLKLRAVRWQLERVEKRVWKALAGAPAPAPQPSVEEVWRCAYEAGFIPWFGDASLALGRAIAMRRRGARGLVNVVPHGCLPGTTSQAAFASRRGALKGMPILHLVVDGAPAAEVRAQVLSFLDAVRAYRVPDYSPALLRRPHARAFVTA